MHTILQARHHPGAAAPGLLLELPRHEVLALADARGQTVTCQSGELWITEEDAGRDLFLQAGQTYTVRSQGNLVVSACQAARIQVDGASGPLTLAHRSGHGGLAGWLRRAHLSGGVPSQGDAPQ